MRKSYLLAMIASLGLAGTALADNRPALPAAPAGGTTEIASGTLDVVGVNGCYMLITGTVTTNPVGGTVLAYINFWDDGIFKATIVLGPFPANGGTHAYQAAYQQPEPIQQLATGIGVYLENAAGLAATVTFDSNGSFNDVTEVCTGPAPDISGFDATAIPTLGRVGLLALVGLVGLAALALMVRRRSASRG
jgi:hypothetical protein